ncbi:MAG TPA: hypothetical protein VF344_08720, partial [Candidatus Limnocylindrales bacterium]
MKLILALVLAAVLVGACNEEGTVYPLPSAPITRGLPTQEGSSSTVGPSTDLAPVKVEWDATHRVLSVGGEKVIWPKGFSSRMLPSGRLDILAPNGSVVARDGDT